MKAIPREAGRITYSTEIRNLKKISFNEYQKAVIIGSILGDGCLCPNWSKTNYRLIISHSTDQEEYIRWKYEILKQWILTTPRYYDKNRSLTIRTISHSELTELRRMFYVKTRKIIPSNILDLMRNPVTIAVWFMDDGNVLKSKGKVRAYHINTQSFTFEENQKLSRILQEIHGVHTMVQKNNGYHRLYVNSKSVVTFANIVRPHLHPSLLYKLG